MGAEEHGPTLRCRCLELPHDAEEAPGIPVLDDDVVSDAEERRAGGAHAAAGRRNACEVARVRQPHIDERGDDVVLTDDVNDLGLDIRERGRVIRELLDQLVRVEVAVRAVVDVVGRE